MCTRFTYEDGVIFQEYFYDRDAFANINGIFDEQGNKVVSYAYDAYGNLLNISDDTTIGIGTINKIRYKGYYYDEETNFFYCNSRYYSPELCRWISPDSIEYLDTESINGLKLYSYCYNNPISYYDPSGHSALLIIGLLAGSFALGFGASVVVQGFSHGWYEINYWQAGLDGLIALGTTALSFTGISAWGMALVGAGTGFGQYAMDSGFHNEQMTWLGAGTTTVLGGIFGFAGGPGVRNSGAIAKNMVGLSDDGARAIGAITNAANRRLFGEISERGMQATLNLYGRTAFNAVQAAIPGTIRHLMIKSIVPGIILPIANLITSIGVGHVYDRLGWC